MANDGKKNLHQSISDQAMMGIVAFEIENHNSFYANDLALETLEYSEFDPNAKPEFKIDQLYPDPAKGGNYKLFNEDLLKHQGFYQDVLVKKFDGTNFVGNLGIKKVEASEGEFILIMFQDVTYQKKLQREINQKQVEIRRAHEELLKQNQQLKELDLAKDRFIALTTHELRTPLSAMIATSEVLKYKLYDDDKQMEEFINTIYQQGFHLLELVNDILDFAKVQAGKMDFYIQEQEVYDLVKKTVDEQNDYAKKSSITIKMEEKKGELKCYFDRPRLRQVLNNVVSNSIKYNRKGGDVLVQFKEDESIVCIVIKDSGVGIPADKIDSVFNEFETLEKVSRHHKGTGLGMPISKRLIENMGGKIWLESEVDAGTTFYIEIPKTKVLEDPEVYRERDEDDFDLIAS